MIEARSSNKSSIQNNIFSQEIFIKDTVISSLHRREWLGLKKTSTEKG
jgi:hypothetical protein